MIWHIQIEKENNNKKNGLTGGASEHTREFFFFLLKKFIVIYFNLNIFDYIIKVSNMFRIKYPKPKWIHSKLIRIKNSYTGTWIVPANHETRINDFPNINIHIFGIYKYDYPLPFLSNYKWIFCWWAHVSKTTLKLAGGLRKVGPSPICVKN